MIQFKSFLNSEAFKLAVLDWSVQLGGGLIIFIIFWIAAIITHRLINSLATRFVSEKKVVIELLAMLGKKGVLTVGLLTALGSMGVDVSALVASLGLTGFALSFAMKDSLSNMVSGLMILFYQPFKMGDIIEVDGKSGQVKGINLRVTSLMSEGNTILIPNTIVFAKTVTINNTSS